MLYLSLQQGYGACTLKGKKYNGTPDTPALSAAQTTITDCQVKLCSHH